MSRVVLRPVTPAEGGIEFSCAGCGQRIAFAAREKRTKVIAHVYEGGRWVRDDHFHPDCYADAGEPLGAAV